MPVHVPSCATSSHQLGYISYGELHGPYVNISWSLEIVALFRIAILFKIISLFLSIFNLLERRDAKME